MIVSYAFWAFLNGGFPPPRLFVVFVSAFLRKQQVNLFVFLFKVFIERAPVIKTEEKKVLGKTGLLGFFVVVVYLFCSF